MVEAFQNALLRVCLLALALLVPVLVASSRRLRRPAAVPLAAFSRLPLPAKAVASIVFFVCMAIGGAKTNAPPRMLSLAVPQVAQAERKAANWNVRGAWKDSFWLDFESGWAFPWGTNHLSGVEVVSFGEVWATPFDTNAVASAGAPFEIVPGIAEFSFEHTPSNSYRLSWTDAAIGRDTNRLVSAAIELFRNGDVAVATNGVAAHFPRMLPFPHDGFGQDDEWVSANFTNATEILAVGYPEWVDSQVGHGLKNGLYKLSVTVPDDPPETALLTVGDLSVAITNAGDYVFLLWKGARYPLSVFPHDFTNCIYSAVDDVQPMRSQEWPVFGDRRWTEERGTLELVVPLFPLVPFSTNDHYVLWKPSLSVSPSTWQPSGMNATETFMAMLDDAPLFASKTFHWTTSDSSAVSIESPDAPVTRMTAHSSSVDGVSLSLTVTVLDCTLHSYFDPEYIDLDDEAYLTVEASPSVVFFEKDTANTESAALTCRYKVNTSGTFSLSMSDGACTVKDSEFNDVQSGYSWYVDEPSSGARHFTVYNSIRSSSASGTVFTVTFTPDEGAGAMSAATSVTFVEVATVAKVRWPNDRSRRTLGVCEEVYIYLLPMVQSLSLSCKGTISGNGSWGYDYTAPSNAETDVIRTIDGTQVCSFDVIAPSGYESVLTQVVDRATHEREAGSFEMLFKLALLPKSVSFSNIEVMEQGMAATNAVGYFSEIAHTNLLEHSHVQGAWRWVGVGVGDNEVGGDTVGVMELSPPWGSGGFLSWPIPNVYRRKGETWISEPFCNTDQSVTLEPNGTVWLEKFNRIESCTTNRHFNGWIRTNQ